MYEDVKKQLHDSFDTITPDLLSVIQEAEIHKIESEDELFACLKENKRGKVTSFIPLASFVAAAVFVCLISIFYYKHHHVTSTIAIKNDMTIILSLNEYNDIVDVTCSGDSGDLKLDYIKGKPLDEGLSDVLNSMNVSNQKKVTIIYDQKEQSQATSDVIHKVKTTYEKEFGYTIKTEDPVNKAYAIADNSQNTEGSTLAGLPLDNTEIKENVIKKNSSDTVSSNAISAEENVSKDIEEKDIEEKENPVPVIESNEAEEVTETKDLEQTDICEDESTENEKVDEEISSEDTKEKDTQEEAPVYIEEEEIEIGEQFEKNDSSCIQEEEKKEEAPTDCKKETNTVTQEDYKEVDSSLIMEESVEDQMQESQWEEDSNNCK